MADVVEHALCNEGEWREGKAGSAVKGPEQSGGAGEKSACKEVTAPGEGINPCLMGDHPALLKIAEDLSGFIPPAPGDGGEVVGALCA